MSAVAEIVSAILIVLGSFLALTAAIGIVRFPDTLSRMHAATKPQVIGLLMILIGAFISLRGNVDIWMIFLVGVFTVLTAPIIAHTVGQVGYREQSTRKDLFMVDDLRTDQGPDDLRVDRVADDLRTDERADD